MEECPACGNQTLHVVPQVGGAQIERCQNPDCEYGKGSQVSGGIDELFGLSGRESDDSNESS